MFLCIDLLENFELSLSGIKGNSLSRIPLDVMGRLFQLCQESHVLDWKVKLVITEVVDAVHFCSGASWSGPVWQEVQGSSHCVLLRDVLRLAKELENVAASVRGVAKTKVESNARMTEWLSGRVAMICSLVRLRTERNKAAEYLALGGPL